MHKKFEPAFKAKVAIEALRGEKTLSRISSEYGVHPNQVSQWKQELLSRSAEIFGKLASAKDREQQELIDKLHRIIGEIKVENDWFKKKLQL